jgi:hypothetical protein
MPLLILEKTTMTKNKLEQSTQRRLDLFNDLFDLCEENGIDLSSNDFAQVSRFAVKDGPITYGGKADEIKSLVDLKVEDLSDKEATVIIKRARTALKRILEMRTKYVAGPFFSNRKQKRMMSRTKAKTSYRSLKASDIVKKIKENKIMSIPTI